MACHCRVFGYPLPASYPPSALCDLYCLKIEVIKSCDINRLSISIIIFHSGHWASKKVICINTRERQQVTFLKFSILTTVIRTKSFISPKYCKFCDWLDLEFGYQSFGFLHCVDNNVFQIISTHCFVGTCRIKSGNVYLFLLKNSEKLLTKFGKTEHEISYYRTRCI